MGIRLRRNSALPVIGAEGILGDGRGDAATAREDLAGIVQGFAKGIGEIPSQATERPDLQFVLEAIIAGPGAVVASANQREVAVWASKRGCRAGAGRSAAGRARRHACRNILGCLYRQTGRRWRAAAKARARACIGLE